MADLSGEKLKKLEKLGFVLGHDDKVLQETNCALERTILHQGTLYVTTNFLCFYSHGIVSKSLREQIPWLTVKSIEKKKSALFVPNAIEIKTSEGKNLFFASFLHRDAAYETIHNHWERARKIDDIIHSSQPSQPEELNRRRAATASVISAGPPRPITSGHSRTSSRDETERIFNGEIHLSLHFVRGEDESGSAGTLHVEVFEVKDLPPRGTNGSEQRHCFVRLLWGNQIKETKVAKESLHPVFQERFAFEVTAESTIKTVQVAVFDDLTEDARSRLSTSEVISPTAAHPHHHQFIGYASIRVSLGNTSTVDTWFPLLKEPLPEPEHQLERSVTPATSPNNGGTSPNISSSSSPKNTPTEIIPTVSPELPMTHQTFELAPSEKILAEYTCSLDKGFLAHGTLFVSEHFVCFLAQILSKKVKEKIEIKNIASLERKKTALVVPNALEIKTEDGHKYLFTSLANREETYQLIQNQVQALKSTTPASPPAEITASPAAISPEPNVLSQVTTSEPQPIASESLTAKNSELSASPPDQLSTSPSDLLSTSPGLVPSQPPAVIFYPSTSSSSEAQDIKPATSANVPSSTSTSPSKPVLQKSLSTTALRAASPPAEIAPILVKSSSLQVPENIPAHSRSASVSSISSVSSTEDFEPKELSPENSATSVSDIVRSTESKDETKVTSTVQQEMQELDPKTLVKHRHILTYLYLVLTWQRPVDFGILCVATFILMRTSVWFDIQVTFLSLVFGLIAAGIWLWWLSELIFIGDSVWLHFLGKTEYSEAVNYFQSFESHLQSLLEYCKIRLDSRRQQLYIGLGLLSLVVVGYVLSPFWTAFLFVFATLCLPGVYFKVEVLLPKKLQ
eukprot:TRINITY_DN5661_c0_g1_i2.p1 TRINITY_DN5661_c0_g1~~TRINITY_DN5661_c0_g1_i2.p1  ORF type:complete len:854 (+),score=143.61 TRINITY_DN5661_c0_g1_i2:74-2635(+)